MKGLLFKIRIERCQNQNISGLKFAKNIYMLSLLFYKKILLDEYNVTFK